MLSLFALSEYDRPELAQQLGGPVLELHSEGLFVFSLIFPQAAMLEDVPEEKPWFTYQTGAGVEMRVSGTEHYNPLTQVKLETAYRRWTEADGSERVRVAPLSLRYTFPQELRALLHFNGFEVEQAYGGFDRSPLAENSTGMLYVCRLSA